MDFLRERPRAARKRFQYNSIYHVFFLWIPLEKSRAQRGKFCNIWLPRLFGGFEWRGVDLGLGVRGVGVLAAARSQRKGGLRFWRRHDPKAGSGGLLKEFKLYTGI